MNQRGSTVDYQRVTDYVGLSDYKLTMKVIQTFETYMVVLIKVSSLNLAVVDNLGIPVF